VTDDDEDLPLEPWAVGLRPLDASFVREFLIDLNSMQAMIRNGVSESTARANAYKTIRRPAIAKAIAMAMQDRADALKITAKTVLGEAFRSYLAASEAKQWGPAARFLEMCGKHVDVQAFRTQVGLSDPNGEPLVFDLSAYSTDEKRQLLSLLERVAGAQPSSVDEGITSIN
jgi:hypothetical protein